MFYSSMNILDNIVTLCSHSAWITIADTQAHHLTMRKEFFGSQFWEFCKLQPWLATSLSLMVAHHGRGTW